MNKFSAVLVIAAAAQATPLSAGVFSFFRGKVKKEGNQVTTGNASRTEAKVDKNGSIVRVGSNTSASVSDKGGVSISKGVVLVSSGEGFLRRPPVQVSTPQGDVTVRGSAIVAALPDGSVKMTVLEGSARGSLGGKDMALNPGQLMIQRHETRDAVKVDLSTLTASSTLLDGSQYQLPLPAAPTIQREAMQQMQTMGGTLTLTGANNGSGNQVANPAELRDARNAETAAASGSTMGGTLRISSSGNYASGSTVNLNAGATLSSGTLSQNHPTRAVGPVNSATITPSVPGTNPPTNPSGLVISGSNILVSNSATLMISGGASTSGPPQITLANNLVNANGNSSTPITSGTLVHSGSGTLTVNPSTSSSLVLTPGSTLTGTLTISGASLADRTVVGSTVRIDSGSLTGSTNAISGSGVYQNVDWSNWVTSTGSSSSSGTLSLPDLSSIAIGGWDMSMLSGGGVILVVGPGYTGPGTTAATTTQTNPPAAVP